MPSPIGKWTAIKLEHLDNYLQAYRLVTKRAPRTYYIDLFAGCGECQLTTNNQVVYGSPWRALNAVPRFSAYYFVEKNAQKAEHLRKAIRNSSIDNAFVYEGDCNRVIPEKVLPRVPQNTPSFAFIDPYGLQLHWSTVTALALHRRPQRMELLILYPDMAMERVLPVSCEHKVAQKLTLFFGNPKWEEEWNQSLQWDEEVEQRHKRFVELYTTGLRKLGYKHVEIYGPMYSSRNRPLYHVIFAGDNDIGAKIMKDVWGKTRFVPGEMLYNPVRRPKST